MGIFSKKIDDITKDDLESLIAEQERENIQLDYKKAINPSTGGKHDLIRHTVGMANTEGGYIIFGIEENKENGIPVNLLGITPSVGNQKVDEWVENVINPHISPRVVVKIKTIPIDSDKIVLILWVPESSRRPHMSTFEDDFRIYRRYNTQTLPASEGEIREMYMRSSKTEKKLEDFINKKNLTDTSSNEFAMTINSKSLIPKIEGVVPDELPFVLLSACPRFIEERIDISSDQIGKTIQKNFQTIIENHNITLIKPRDSALDSNSITYSLSNSMQGNMLEYLEVQRNGFVEQGMTFRVIRSNEQKKFFLNLGRTTVAIWVFIKFVKALYEETNYFDEFSVFLSIRNLNQLSLNGFYGLSKDGTPWAPIIDDLEDYLDVHPPFAVTTYAMVFTNTPKEKNFSLNFSLNPNKLNDKELFDIVKTFSTRLANAYGVHNPPCYNHDGSFAQTHLDRYNKLFSF